MKHLARYGIIGLNIAIAILGAALFGIGVDWIEVELAYEKATEKPYIYLGAFLMALGALLGVITVLAFYAAITKNQYIVDIIGFLSLLLFIVYADYGIIAFQLRIPSSPYMEDFRKELVEVFDKPKKHWVEFFDYLHRKLLCCGIDGYKDFQTIHNRSHPATCCDSDVSNCAQPTYERGCVIPFEKYIEHNFLVSGSISFSISFLNIFSTIFTLVTKKRRVAGLANDEL